MGRPRKYAIGTTAAKRVELSTAALIEAGGARKTFRLSPRANQALRFLISQDKARTETSLVESLLISEEAKARSKKNRQAADMEQKKKIFITETEDFAVTSGSAALLISLIASGEIPVRCKTTDFASIGDVIIDAASLTVVTQSKRTVISSTLRLSEQCKKQNISVIVDGRVLTDSIDLQLTETLCRVFWAKALILSHTNESLEMSKVIDVC